jgi:hypothetical protein
MLNFKLRGGNTIKNGIIINTDTNSTGEFKTVAKYENGAILQELTAQTANEAARNIHKVFNDYAEPRQKAFFNAGLVEGEKYTIMCMSDFGFPVTIKCKIIGVEYTTYAQHSDVVKVCCIPYKSRKARAYLFYSGSVIIFKGWQELKEEDTYNIEEVRENCIMRRSKYGCFDPRYFEDVLKKLKNPVVVYKEYKSGANGKAYA